jgi:hypothetical protein
VKLSAIDAKNWVAFPIAPLTPTTPDQQKWVAVLSGTAVLELEDTDSSWTHDELTLTLDDMLQAIFTMAERAPSTGHHLRFIIESVASFTALNSIPVGSRSDQGDFGFAIEAAEPSIIGHTIRCFAGLTLKVAIANNHVQLVSVGFQITMTGWIREFRTKTS